MLLDLLYLFVLQDQTFQIKCNFISFPLLQAMLFRLPWKLWRYMEGGKMEEFGLEAKRHIIGPEEEETLAHQYATAFHSVLHRNNLYFAQVLNFEKF